MAERDLNPDSLSPVSGLLTVSFHNPKREFTVFQVLLPSQPLSHFHEVRSHTEDFNKRAFLTPGYKSSWRKQNNEATIAVS